MFNFCLLCLQLDIFQLVGEPLVENCMAGFNSSVFAYGQVCCISSSTLLFPEFYDIYFAS